MTKKTNAFQDIDMQITRLETILDELHNHANNNYGAGHKTTQRALKAILYFQGLKYDLAVLKQCQLTIIK